MDGNGRASFEDHSRTVIEVIANLSSKDADSFAPHALIMIHVWPVRRCETFKLYSNLKTIYALILLCVAWDDVYCAVIRYGTPDSLFLWKLSPRCAYKLFALHSSRLVTARHYCTRPPLQLNSIATVQFEGQS